MAFRTVLYDLRFWLASLERAVLTLIQTMAAQAAVFSAADIEKMGLTGLPWSVMVSVSLFAGLSSLLTSLGKGGVTKGRGPGLAEQLVARKPSLPPVVVESEPVVTPVAADADPAADVGPGAGK